MNSSKPGEGTLPVEIGNIDRFGFWLLVGDSEYFLSYEDFPWFREAKVADILNVELVHDTHLYWPVLDVDLCVESLERPERYPLVSSQPDSAGGERVAEEPADGKQDTV